MVENNKNKFIEMSKYAGMREDLVQAGGGNSAFKITPDRMAIKASGFQLADVTENTGYAIVNPQIVRDAFLNCKNLEDMTEEESKKILSDAFIEGAKPSIETFLHSISGRYSLHTHPIVVNALTCRKNGDTIIKELFPDALMVPYATPGVSLAKAYFSEYKEYKKSHETEPKTVFLMNHGFMASADTAEEIMMLTENVTQKIETYLGVDYSAYHEIRKVDELFDEGITWLVSDKNVIDTAVKLGGIWKHHFCPDCVVFLGKKTYVVSGNSIDKSDFDRFVERNGYPAVVSYKGYLYIHAESVKKALETQSVLSFSAQVMSINQDVACRLLPESEMNFLLNWDAEKYRKNMK